MRPKYRLPWGRLVSQSSFGFKFKCATFIDFI